jgi:ATP-dependent Lhr-like helicase
MPSPASAFGPTDTPVSTALAWAHPVVQEWFLSRFGTPTEPQEAGWPHIVAGRPTLISAPTGSGKTLAAFLICIDKLIRCAIEGTLDDVTEVVYISPLKALSNDVRKNLEQPLAEIQQLALERGLLCSSVRTAVRTGDTLQSERRMMLKRPPHILVTTPESLYILLTAEKSRNNLRRVRTVIVDEIHAIADDKRGAHLALSLERLDALICGENRLTPAGSLTGLSTQNPISLVGEFLVGCKPAARREASIPFVIPTGAQRSGGTCISAPPQKWVPHPGEARVGSNEFTPASVGSGCPTISAEGDEVGPAIIKIGSRRTLDLAIELPNDELGSIASNAIWDSVYDRLAELALEHKSTLVFVNTRRMVERLAYCLGERIGAENVAAHHGSLSRQLRHEAERRLKAGEIKLLVATASLELGIDIGAIDLVCQVNTPRAIGAAMQRVGRAGHWRGAIPKGRFFATTRDDLIEQAALIRAMQAGDLDKLEIPPCPLDILMQQIVAACAAEPWQEDDLYEVLRRAYPYRNLHRDEYEELLCLLTDGIESSRGRYGSYLLRDRIHGRLQARRGARMVAISNGGSIPDTAIYAVILQPEGVQIATLDEHFAVDSRAGDIVLLGNTSWRIQRVESAGRVLVEDAHGQPPNVPFWAGEAPQRTFELSQYVSALREEVSRRIPTTVLPGYVSATHPDVAACVEWLIETCCVPASGAMQMIAYVVAGRAVLGSVPTLTTIVAERFFDEGGGMQLILHAPFGGRINKAWGLALRKRFCRGFNFELQAAATDNGLNISLAEQHSFPLSDVFRFLTVDTVTELLQQASLTSPIFKARWRWDAGRSLQLLRMQKGKRVPPQIQRTRGDDLLASVFPSVAACQENIEGDIEIPNHPLIREVMKDVLQEAMDLEGLIRVLAGIESGAIQCVAVDTTTPSAFAHELLNANPYAYLDDAPQEERRARAVNMRGVIPDKLLGEAGRLDPDAIAQVREECRPDIRDEHELHDQLYALVVVPAAVFDWREARDWPLFMERLVTKGRAAIVETHERHYLVATEHHIHFQPLSSRPQRSEVEEPASPLAISQQSGCPIFSAAGGEVGNREAVRSLDSPTLQKSIHGWLNILGPVTANSLAAFLSIEPAEIYKAFLAMEMQGNLIRGVFEGSGNLGAPHLASEMWVPTSEHSARTAANPDHDIEWCERRLLQRIHKRTLATLRKQVEPVTPAVYMRWLLHWQHLAPQSQLSGKAGVLAALRQLEGFEAPAIEWETSLLPQRVRDYDPRMLDALCLSGAVGWGRISPHPAFSSADHGAPRRVVPTSMAPITFFLRDSAQWMDLCLAGRTISETVLCGALSELALKARACFENYGAVFSADLVRLLGAPATEISRALWELVAAGLVTADGFDSLRMLIDPRRKQAMSPRARTTVGRWCLLHSNSLEDKIPKAQLDEQQHESACWTLLARYGVVFRDLLARETTMPRWRDLLPMYRRLEAQGQLRGGRFLSGFGGEQFALPEAVESLREGRRQASSTLPVTIAAADPMNLVGTVVPGERAIAIPGRTVTFTGGQVLTENAPATVENGASLIQNPAVFGPNASLFASESLS